MEEEGGGEEQQLDRQAGGVQGLQARGHGPPEASPACQGGQAHPQPQEHGLQVLYSQQTKAYKYLQNMLVYLCLQVPPEEVLLAVHLVHHHREVGE